MNIFTSSGILILIMFVLAFLQFIPSIFLLFSHYSHGQLSHKKASKLSQCFTLGAFFGIALVFLLVYIILACTKIFSNLDSTLFSWIFSGIFFATSLIVFLLYYRKGKNTKLFVSRKLVQKYHYSAAHSKTPSEAFLLGFLSVIPELFLTIPLFACASTELIVYQKSPFIVILYILFIILSATIPLFAIRIAYHHHSNLATIQKLRIKNKTFIKCFLSLTYLLIATIIISFRIIS